MSNTKNPFEGVTNQAGNASNEQKIPVLTSENVSKDNKKIEVDANVFMKMLDTMNKTLSALGNQKIDAGEFGKAIANALKDREVVGLERIYDKSDIDPNDYLELPAIFFAYTFKTTIFDDIKFGKPIVMPYFPVQFNPMYRFKDPNSKDKMISMCMAVVYSKSQADFIRQHSLFGIKFFEKIESNKSIDTSYQEKLVSAYNAISTKSEFEIQQMCLNNQIKIDTQDFSELRKRLAHKFASDFMVQESHLQKDTMRIDVSKDDEQDIGFEKEILSSRQSY